MAKKINLFSVDNGKITSNEVNTTQISLPQKNSKTAKKVYNNELAKQKEIQNKISNTFSDNGVQVVMNPFSAQRVMLPAQNQVEAINKKKFEVNKNPLQQNVDVENKFRNVKNSDDYKALENELAIQSNNVGYAKYDYDKAKIDEKKVNLFDKTVGTVVRGAGSILDYSGGLIKNENGDLQYLPNKSELMQQKVQDSYKNPVTKFMGTAGYEVGRIGGSTLLNTALPGSNIGGIAYFGKMFEDSYNNAISMGYTGDKAMLYGIASTGMEYATGALLGSATKGLTGGKASGYEKLLNDTFTRLTKNKFVSKILANAGSEATEEFLQEFIDNINKIAILDNSKNIKDYTSVFTNEDIWKDAIYSALVGGVTGGFFGAFNNTDNEIENNKDVYEILKEQLEETRKNTNDATTINQIDSLISEIDKNNTDLNINENNSVKTVQDLVENSETNTNINTVQDLVNSEKNNLFIQSATENNIDINNATIQEINRVLNDREINAKFDASLFQNNNQEAFWNVSTDENGNVVREVVFNPNTDSSKTLQNLSVHELYHDIANTKQAQQIQTELLDYVSRIDGYQEARNNLENTYKSLKNSNGDLIYNPSSTEFKALIDEEVTANILGEKLGNQEFVTNLTNSKPTIARSVYNWVIDKLNKLNKLTGYKSEKIFWKDVKNKFDTAYRIQYNSNQQINSNSNVMFATRTNNPYGHVKEFVNLDIDIQKDAHRVISTKALSLFEQGKKYGVVYDINGNLYTFDIFDDAKYRVSEVELYNEIVEEVVDETNINRNSQYSLESSTNGQSNNDVDYESNKNRRTSSQDAILPTKESKQQRNNGYGLSDTKQNGIDKGLDNSSFYNTKNSISNDSWNEFTKNNFSNQDGYTIKDLKLPTKDTNLKSLEQNAPLPTREEFDNRVRESAKQIEKELGYMPQNPTKESTYAEPVSDPITEFKRQIDRELASEVKTTKQIKKTNTLKRQVTEMYDHFQEQFVNRNHYIDKFSKETGNREILFKGDMLNGVAGEITGEVNVAQTDNYGNRIGQSLSSLFEKSKKNGYYEQFDDYLKHQSNIDRHQYGKGSVVPLEYSQKMVQAYEQTIPGIKAEAEKVWQYGKNLLKNQRENGVISQSTMNTLEEMYPHYVPYMQADAVVPYMEESGEIKPKKAIKRAEGKAHDLITIEDALEKYTYSTKKSVRQNDLYKEIVKSARENVQIGFDERVDGTQMDNCLQTDVEGNRYLTAYEDGVPHTVKISEELYKELSRTTEKNIKGLEEKYSLILNPIQKVSEVRRKVLTEWRPSFLISNAVKDIQDASLNSKYTTDMLKNYSTALYELATQNTKEAQQFSTLYGSGMVMGDYQIDKINGSIQNMDVKQVNNLIRAIPNLNELIELSPRYAEFKASLQNGTSVTEAMYNAREVTTNFNRGGYITKALNRNGFTFLNASVQGFEKMVRNLTGVNGTKGFVAGTTGIMMKVAALSIAPELFNAMSFGEGSDDEDEAYKALPNYIKDNYYLIKIKGLKAKTSKYYDGTFLRIPKGRMLSVFGSAARRTLNYVNGDKDAFDGYLDNTWNQIGFNDPEENNIFAPIKQAFGSKNGEAWYGGDLVPKRLQNKPVAEQYDESTDEFSKWLGDMLNVSPYKINYLLDQYSGVIGDTILPMITPETSNGASSITDYLIAPIKDQFVVNSTDDNKYASNFYSNLEKAQVKANGYKATNEEKLQYKYMSKISSSMSELYKEKREVQMDNTLSKKEKYKKVQSIQKEINSLAEEGTEVPKVKDLKSNYAKIKDTEYYKNQKGEWTVVKDEEASELKDLKMNSTEKNNYFNAKNKISEVKGLDISTKEKKTKISNIILDMNMSDNKLAYLYGKYYSNEDTLKVIQDAGISVKEFIKYNLEDFEGEFNEKTGKVVANSKKKELINYVNQLNLSIPQKALLIKMKYSSYKTYDKEVEKYVNSRNITFLEKAAILKKAGFTSYDKQIISYVQNMSNSKDEKEEILEDLGFTVRNGKVYSK